MISAEAHSDDYEICVKFDATAWFEQASDDAIVALARIHFGQSHGDAADQVAEFYRDTTTARLFDYLATDPRTGPKGDDPVGFECSISDPVAAVNWIRQYRPHVIRRIKRGDAA